MDQWSKPFRAVLPFALLFGAALPAAALAGAGPRAAKSTRAPRAGAWKMAAPKGPNYGFARLKSGRFTVQGQFVTHLQATVTEGDSCPGGALRVAAKLPIVEAELAGGGHQWYVAAETGSVGGGHLQPVAISLTVHGQSQINASMMIAFPAVGKKTQAVIGWGDDGTGDQNCSISFTVKRG
jgi:hypothetical protein